MIRELFLKNFKCFSGQRFPLRNLTLLAGANASGKTSLLQSLLVLRQSFDAGRLAKGQLVLVGEWVSVGSAQDAFRANRAEPDMLFEVEDGQGRRNAFRFRYEPGNKDAYVLSSKNENPSCANALFLDPFAYLCAERWGPRLLYPMDTRATASRNVGIQGEFAAFCLATYGQEELANRGLEYPDSRERGEISLERQVSLWMREIVPELEIDAVLLPRADRVSLGLRNQKNETRFLRPPNIGFGICYALSVVVAVLLSTQGSMVLIENPEAHLHPFGQSKLGQFLARAAAAGVQIIVETHSDHLLNGVRLAVKRGLLSSEEAVIHFFHPPFEQTAQVQTLFMDKEGRISDWPAGFFDQAEQDLMELL